VPVAEAAASDVADVPAVSWKHTLTLDRVGVTEPLLVDRNAAYFR